MNMNTLYIMLGFIFVYAMIANVRDKSVNYTLISYWNLLWEFINNLIKMFTSAYKTYIIFI